MTRAEKIKIRAERVRQRILRAETAKLAANTTTTTTTVEYAEIPKEELTLEIMIHCYHYEKRLCWMLSSLVQQIGDAPNMIVNISHAPNTGNPTTEEVINFFREKGLDIKETLVTQEQVSNRAIARNKQSTETNADWVLFSDSDMVFDPMFFDDLQKQLKTNLKNTQLVMGADRHSLDDKFCIQYFEQDNTTYPTEIKDVSKIVSQWKIKWVHGAGTVAGNFQLISGKVLKEKCGGLVTGRPRDHWRRTRGDRALRVRVGGRIGIKTLPMFHLNHDRLGPEIQR